MNLENLLFRINAAYDEIDNSLKEFKNISGISCPPGCGNCCEYPRIEASILEFLPLAKFLWDTDKALKIYQQIEAHKTTCIFYKNNIENPDKWRCSVYKYRGYICRMFGFMLIRDKNDKLKFNTCNTIRRDYTNNIELLELNNYPRRYLPVTPDTSYKFYNIAPELSYKKYPINQAIKFAIEKVYYYRDKYSFAEEPVV